MPAPLRPEDLLLRLTALGIESRTVAHAPVFTVEQAKAVRSDGAGVHVKNLFLRNKKGAMWLVVALEDRVLDLRSLGARLGAGKLSFGSPERLLRHLGVIPGAVTPFAIVNDRAGEVRVAVDRAVLGAERVSAHPLANDRTTTLAVRDLVRFLELEGHPPVALDLDGG
ncbi:MAG: prolyl-tRNA synthetase associated domain-containing protein [Myxococcales bacterium]|nr:prolyl-tRNA synthetase associated domain-containing protein [Myxococcales bacterium]